MNPSHPATGSTPLLSTRFGLRIVALFLALAILLVTVAVQVYRAVGEFVEASDWVAHTMEVEQEIVATIASLRDAEASQRAFVISGSAERLADHHGALPRIGDHQARLAGLVANNPQQAANVQALSGLLDRRLAGMREILDLFEREGIAAMRTSAPVQRSRDEDAAIEAAARRMLAIEDQLLAERRARTDDKAMLTRLLTIGAVISCIIILGAALVFVLREQARRLRSEGRVRSTNEELTHSLDESQRLGRTLRQLGELGEMLQGCRSPAEATTGLAVALPQLLPRMSGSISLINSSQNLVETVAAWGEAGTAGEGLFAPDDCWALRRGQAYPPAGVVPPFRCRHLPATAGADSRAHLCIPLLAQGSMLGIMTLVADEPADAAERAVAVATAEQVSMALANLRLQETLRTQSLRDPLTGLFNRRYLEASLDRELQRSARGKQPLSVLMLDIDHFKRFNDTHGHDAGDALLAQFGALLARSVRSEDVACRYGGEEFTILLHETDAEQAVERAEQICAAVRTLDVQHRRQTLGPVTVSIGIATAPRDGNAPDELLHSADRALYAAKHGGRDQARLAA
ncbi:MAG: GGDEF domain-containing protein [Xanthomonadales bacterium]|nr:GGDEF domain-containing protein [Xanthomonadales bacterium]